MFHDVDFFMGGMHFLWWIFWIVLIGGLVYAAWGRPAASRRRAPETPHEALQRRLAQGEITAEEHEKRKVLLDRDAAAKA